MTSFEWHITLPTKQYNKSCTKLMPQEKSNAKKKKKKPLPLLNPKVTLYFFLSYASYERIIEWTKVVTLYTPPPLQPQVLINTTNHLNISYSSFLQFYVFINKKYSEEVILKKTFFGGKNGFFKYY